MRSPSSTFDFHRQALKAPSTPYKQRGDRRPWRRRPTATAEESTQPTQQREHQRRKKKLKESRLSVESFLRKLKNAKFPFVVDWALAWFVVTIFAVFYVVQYAWMVLMSRLSKAMCFRGRKEEKSIWMSKRLSVTTLPRSKKSRLDPSKQINYRLGRLANVLEQALVEQGVSRSNIDAWKPAGSPTSMRGSVSQQILRRRIHHQQRGRFANPDDEGSMGSSTMTIRMATDFLSYSDAEIIQALRSNGVARYLASVVVKTANSYPNIANMVKNDTHRQLLKLLRRIWIDTLPFPPIQMDKDDRGDFADGDEEMSRDGSVFSINSISSTYTQTFQKEFLYTISLIVPIYNESFSTVRNTLSHALKRCCDPDHVQVVLVDAGDECEGLAEWCKRANKWASKQRTEPRSGTKSTVSRTPPRSIIRSVSNVSSTSSFSSGDSTSSTPVMALKTNDDPEAAMTTPKRNYYYHKQQHDEESVQSESFVSPLNDSLQQMTTPGKMAYSSDFDDDDDDLMEHVDTPKIEKRKNKTWNRIKHVAFHNVAGGRGACLNYGAMSARGRILCFLHADTLLPEDWDVHVESALLPPTDPDQLRQFREEMVAPVRRWRDLLQPMSWWKRRRRRRREQDLSKSIPTLCAFRFGIDMSRHGLNGRPCTPGLRGALWLGRLRSSLCQMPYGDSALSMPASYFHHIGGFPDQPFMDDYELVTLVRRRTHVMPNERMVILPVSTKCSPRRWQKHGVAYTSLVNALCIWRYEHGWTADDLLKLYYGASREEN